MWNLVFSRLTFLPSKWVAVIIGCFKIQINLAGGLKPPTGFDLFPWVVCGFAWLWMRKICFILTFFRQKIYEQFAAFECINVHLLFRCVLRTRSGIIFQRSHHAQNISFPHRYFAWTDSQADVFRLLQYLLLRYRNKTFPK